MESRVSIVRDSDIERRVLEAVRLLGGVERVVGKGDRVLIKPNMVGGFPPETGETTHPEVVKTLVELAYEAGAKEVLVGDGVPEVPVDTVRRRFVRRPVPPISGTLHGLYKKKIEKAGGKLIDLDRWTEVEVPNPVRYEKVRVARAILDCDVLIGAPTLKTHHLVGITVALKNLYGAIPPKDRRLYHDLDGVEEVIVDINQVRTSDMVVVDGTYTTLHWGMIDQYMERSRLDLTIAGYDPVAVDSVSAKLLGIDPKTLRFLSWAEERGLGKMDQRLIETVGVPVGDVHPEGVMTVIDYMNKRLSRIRLVSCGACTGCFGRVATSLFRRDDSQMSDDVYIVMGPDAKPIESAKKENVILCGNCAAPTFYNRLKGAFIPGCPPNLDILIERLKEMNLKV